MTKSTKEQAGFTAEEKAAMRAHGLDADQNVWVAIDFH